jgi:EAL domain-containing protein (putative c-di-GMP-specific phosphodiesterase class I)
VFYQPIYSLRDEVIVSLEALLRWQRSDGSMLGAPAALRLATTSEARLALDRFVLHRACADMSELVEWFGAGGLHGLNVNLMPSTLIDPRLDVLVADTLEVTGLSPHLLRLEVPETAAFADLAQATDALRAITRSGVNLTLDDVGVEAIGLRYLKRLDIDGLKIDRSFVNRMLNGASDLAVVRLLVEMCAGLEIRLTAEGVERCEQVEVARSLGVRAIQGYHFSRPVPLERTIRLLHEFPRGGAEAICRRCFARAPDGAGQAEPARAPARSR